MTSVIKIVIIIIFFILLYKYFDDYNDNLKLGLCDESEDYVLPKIYNNFITKKEANYIIQNANKLFIKSELVSSKKYDENIRKSETAWLNKNDNIIKNIVLRVCNIGNFSFENVEDMQVVRYGVNGFYKEHHDSFPHNTKESLESLSRGGHRIATMLIYLNDDFEEGGTEFPNLNKIIKPKKYGAILFEPLNKKRTQCHPYALHGGLPIKSGIKYICNIWVRQDKFN
jgi:prolyl 4-hydroxylase